MFPLYVEIEDFNLIERVAIDYEANPYHSVAGPNGTGKSSTPEAVLWCWYGKCRHSAANDVIRIGRERAQVTVIHVGPEGIFKTKRTRERKGRGKTEAHLWKLGSDDWRAPDAVWIPQSGKNLDRDDENTLAKIRRAVGVSYEALVNGPVIMQDDVDRLTKARPGDRKAILREVLGLNEYEQLAKDANESALALEREAAAAQRAVDDLGDVDTALEMAREALAQAEAALQAATAGVATSEAEETAARQAHAQAEAALEAARKRAADLPALREAAERAERAAADARAEAQRLETEAAKRADVDRCAQAIPLLEQEERETQAQLDTSAATEAKRERLAEDVESLTDDFKAARARQRDALVEVSGAALAGAILAQGGKVADLEQLARETIANLELIAATLDERRATLRAASDADAEARAAAERAAAAVGAVDEAEAVVAARAVADAAKTAREAAEAAVAQARAALAALDLKKAEAKAAVTSASLRNDAAHARRKDLERRAALLDDVPCTKTDSDWAPWRFTDYGDGRKSKEMGKFEEGQACDLAGTCKLLAEARAAREQLAEAVAEHEAAMAAETAAAEAQTEANAAHRRAAEETDAAVRAAAAARTDEAVHARAAEATVAEEKARRREAAAAAAEAHRAAGRAQVDALAKVTEAERAVDALPAKRAALVRAETEAAACADIVRRGEEARAALDALPPRADVESLQRQLGAIREDLATARATVAGEAAVAAAEAALPAARERLAATRRALADAVDARDAARDAVAGGDADAAVASERARLALEQAATNRNIAGTAYTDAVAKQARAAAEVERLEVNAAKLAEKRADLKRLKDAAKLDRDCAEALTIAAVILIERAIPAIEAHANSVLKKISSRGMRLELRTQRANRSNEGSQEVLDIVIRDDVGERLWEAYSGGEKFRINIALRLGIGRVLADREGVPVEFLWLDEGNFGALDPDGVASLTEVLAALKADYRQVSVVSHLPQVQEAMPRQIRYRLNGSGGGVAEAA